MLRGRSSDGLGTNAVHVADRDRAVRIEFVVDDVEQDADTRDPLRVGSLHDLHEAGGLVIHNDSIDESGLKHLADERRYRQTGTSEVATE